MGAHGCVETLTATPKSIQAARHSSRKYITKRYTLSWFKNRSNIARPISNRVSASNFNRKMLLLVLVWGRTLPNEGGVRSGPTLSHLGWVPVAHTPRPHDLCGRRRLWMYWVNQSETKYFLGKTMRFPDTVDLAHYLNYTQFRPREQDYTQKCSLIEHAVASLDVDAIVFDSHRDRLDYIPDSVTEIVSTHPFGFHCPVSARMRQMDGRPCVCRVSGSIC